MSVHAYAWPAPWSRRSLDPRIAKASEIDGWMSPEALIWLAEQARRRTRIVEIGSYKGRSTKALCDNTQGTVLAIDDFAGPRDVVGQQNVLGDFLGNLGDHFGVTLMVDLGSHEGAAARHPETFDMVFIDGDHEYESVRRDISQWLPKIEPGGIICGDDVNLPGVRRALGLLPHWKQVPGTILWCSEIS